MGYVGFSYVGFVFLLMLAVPNLIWTKHQPMDYNYQNEKKVLLVLKQVGQVCVMCTAPVFPDFNLHGWSGWNFWLLAAAVLMILPACWWVRYFQSKKALKVFYGSFGGIPVAGATLPVFSFFLLVVYGKVIWLMASIIVLGIGHIGIYLQHLKEIPSKL